MRRRYFAILGLWVFAAGFSIYSAIALHSLLIPIVSIVLAACATSLRRSPPPIGILRVMHETIEDQLVESSLGFSVQLTSTALVYREGARSVTILPFTEPGKPVAFRMAANIPLAWDSPHGNDPISPKGQEEIRHRVDRCISFLPSAQLSRKQKHALRKKRKEMRELAENTPVKK